MARSEIVEKNTIKKLTSSDNIKIFKEVNDGVKNAMNNNTKDFKELCEVARDALKHSEPSNEYYKTLQRILDLCEKDFEEAKTEEEKDKIRQEIRDVKESLDKIQEEKNVNNKKIFEAVNEASKENRQINKEFVKMVAVAAIAFTGGIFLGTKCKDTVNKFIDKK